MKKHLFLIVLLCLLYPIVGFATTIPGLNEPVGYAGMNGMKVTVDFGTGSPETQFWAVMDASAEKSGVTGAGWGLTFTGANSFPWTDSNQWSFNSDGTKSIDKITINALPGNSVFDIYWGTTSAQWFTQGSYFGYWSPNATFDDDDNITYVNTNTGTSMFGGYEATWSFTGPVQVGASPVMNDVYTTLEIDFTDPVSIMNFSFTLDTDHVVPEPTTMLLFGLGLLGFSAVSRKKIKA